jgi:hypothetical protein
LFEFVTTPLTPSTCKMNTKPKEEGFQSPLRSMPCWHINEKNHQPIGANIGQRLLWLEGEIGSLGIDRHKDHPWLELQL